MSDEVMSAAAVAEFDQAYASSASWLDQLVAAHRLNVERITPEGIPEAVAVGALMRYLLEEVSHETSVSALTVAVVRIDRALKEAGL